MVMRIGLPPINDRLCRWPVRRQRMIVRMVHTMIMRVTMVVAFRFTRRGDRMRVVVHGWQKPATDQVSDQGKTGNPAHGLSRFSIEKQKK